MQMKEKGEHPTLITYVCSQVAPLVPDTVIRQLLNYHLQRHMALPLYMIVPNK
jgi:hypothetical protein